jgi:hypothetical protein
MKISRSSPHKLICEDDTFWTSFTQFFVIGVIGIACYSYGQYTSNPSFKIGLYAFLIGVFVCLFSWQSTTIFDLNKKSVQFQKYWVIFRGRHCKEYPLSSIKNIELHGGHKHGYLPAVRLQNGKVMTLTNVPIGQVSANLDIAKIRSFLGFN